MLEGVFVLLQPAEETLKIDGTQRFHLLWFLKMFNKETHSRLHIYKKVPVNMDQTMGMSKYLFQNNALE